VAARRCKVSKTHPLPLTVAPQSAIQMRCIEALLVLVPDGRPSTGGIASISPDLLRVLHKPSRRG